MRTNTQGLLDNFTAVVTLLGGETRIDPNNCVTGTLSPGTQDIEKLAPTCVVNALGQMMVFHHSGDDQIFYNNMVKMLGIGPGNFEMMISALTVHFEMSLCGILRGDAPSMTPLLASAHHPLFTPEGLLNRAIVTRISNGIAFRVSKEDFQANVNANIRMITSTWLMLCLWLRLADDQGIPMSICSQHKMDGFGRPL